MKEFEELGEAISWPQGFLGFLGWCIWKWFSPRPLLACMHACMYEPGYVLGNYSRSHMHVAFPWGFSTPSPIHYMHFVHHHPDCCRWYSHLLGSHLRAGGIPLGIVDSTSSCALFNLTAVAAELAALQKVLPAGMTIVMPFVMCVHV